MLTATAGGCKVRCREWGHLEYLDTRQMTVA